MPPLFAPERQKNGLSTVLLSVCFKRRMTLQTPLSRYNYEKEHSLHPYKVPRPTSHFPDVLIKCRVPCATFPTALLSAHGETLFSLLKPSLP